MSSKIVFKNQDGEADTGDDFDIFANEKAARDSAATKNFAFYYTKVSAMSPTAIQNIPYAGFKGMDGRAMRGNTNQFAIEGFIIGKEGSDQTEEVNIYNGLLNLLGKAKLKATWLVTLTPAVSAAVILSSTGDCNIGDIIANGVGDSSGPRWAFTLPIVNLGSEDS